MLNALFMSSELTILSKKDLISKDSKLLFEASNYEYVIDKVSNILSTLTTGFR